MHYVFCHHRSLHNSLVMKFTVEIKELKERGYTFQKLYASDHKSYRKKIGDYTIWLWVMERELEIDCWYQHTDNIVKFFKKHDNKKTALSGMDKYMQLKVNQKTSEVLLKEPDALEYTDAYVKKWENWKNVVIHIESFREVIKEVNILTGQK